MNTEKMMRTLRLRKVVVRECFQWFFQPCKSIVIRLLANDSHVNEEREISIVPMPASNQDLTLLQSFIFSARLANA